jgi:hypothetical protein
VSQAGAGGGALRELLAVFGVKVDDHELQEANEHVEGFVGKLKEFAGLLLGGYVGEAFLEFAHHTAEVGEQIEKAAIRTGLTTDALQELGFAAGQSGSSVEGLTMALLQLQDRAGDAVTNAAGENAKAFRKLGIDVRDSNGHVKDADVLLEEVSDKLSGMKSNAEKVTAAVNLFGRSGRELLPLLADGKEGIAALREEFRALGGGYSKEAVKASKEYSESLKRLGVVADSVRGRIAVVLLPALQKAVEFFVKVGVAFLEFSKNSEIIKATLITLGAIAATFAIRALAAFTPLLLTLAKIALVIAILDDVIVFLEGGDSVIGAVIDKLFGVGTSAKVAEAAVKGLTLWWQALKAEVMFVVHAVESAIDKFEKLYQFAQRLGLKVLDKVGLDADTRRDLKEKIVGKAGDYTAEGSGLVGKAASLYGTAYGAIGHAVSAGANFIGDKANALVGEPSTLTYGPPAPTVSVPVPGAAPAGKTVNVENHNTVTVQTGPGHDEIRKVVGEELDRSNRETVDTLAKHVETDE